MIGLWTESGFDEANTPGKPVLVGLTPVPIVMEKIVLNQIHSYPVTPVTETGMPVPVMSVAFLEIL